MNIFTIFFTKILAKYSPKRTILKNFLGGACSRTPPPPHPSKRVTSPCKYPYFYKHILNPPPRNKILDTPRIG